MIAFYGIFANHLCLPPSFSIDPILSNDAIEFFLSAKMIQASTGPFAFSPLGPTHPPVGCMLSDAIAAGFAACEK